VDSLPLSQVVLINLLRKLPYCINNNLAQIVVWMTKVFNAIIPSDSAITLHVRPIFNDVYVILNYQSNLLTITDAERSNIRHLIQVITSTLGLIG
jgi:enhancer of mRNA-decapping protein 4